MARVSTCLNFSRNNEEAYNFYKSIFGGEALSAGGGVSMELQEIFWGDYFGSFSIIAVVTLLAYSLGYISRSAK